MRNTQRLSHTTACFKEKALTPTEARLYGGTGQSLDKLGGGGGGEEGAWRRKNFSQNCSVSVIP